MKFIAPTLLLLGLATALPTAPDPEEQAWADALELDMFEFLKTVNMSNDARSEVFKRIGTKYIWDQHRSDFSFEHGDFEHGPRPIYGVPDFMTHEPECLSAKQLAYITEMKNKSVPAEKYYEEWDKEIREDILANVVMPDEAYEAILHKLKQRFGDEEKKEEEDERAELNSLPLPPLCKDN